jgi:hypothetical protein
VSSFDSIDTTTLVAFARIGAVVAVRVEDYYPEGKRWWVGCMRKAASASGAETARLEGHSGWVSALCVLPDGRLASGSWGHHALAIGAEGRTQHRAGMACEDGGLFAGVGVPQPRGVVARRGHHALAIGAEGRAQHWADMACEETASLPLSASHSRAVWSEDAVTTRLPSGLKAALSTGPV